MRVACTALVCLFGLPLFQTAGARQVQLVPAPLLGPPAPPAPPPAPVRRTTVTHDALVKLIRDDLRKELETRGGAEELLYLRYLSVGHIYNTLLIEKKLLRQGLVGSDLYQRDYGGIRSVAPSLSSPTLWLYNTPLETLDEKFNRTITETLVRYQLGFSKLVNSLSWKERVVPPVPLGVAPGEPLVYRIDIRDYGWEASWKRVDEAYPYGVLVRNEEAREICRLTGAREPYVWADWFAYAVTRPPLYHDMLDLPRSVRNLERKLGIDVSANIQTGQASRAALARSDVSRNNRLLERHEIKAYKGAYWKSYDFASVRTDLHKNILVDPLGPGLGTHAFRNDAGEIIFHLPNGLLGFLIVDGQGNRLDSAPVTVVSDTMRSQHPVVETGVSCMNCHRIGFMPIQTKASEALPALGGSTVGLMGSSLGEGPFLASSVLIPGRSLSETAERPQLSDRIVVPLAGREANAQPQRGLSRIQELYKAPAVLDALILEDFNRYYGALKQAGTDAGALGSDPVNELVSVFEARLTLARASAELGMAPDEFVRRLSESPRFLPRLTLLQPMIGVESVIPNSVRVGGGTIDITYYYSYKNLYVSFNQARTLQREEFEEVYPDLVRTWGYAGYPPGDVVMLVPGRGFNRTFLAWLIGAAVCLALAFVFVVRVRPREEQSRGGLE